MPEEKFFENSAAMQATLLETCVEILQSNIAKHGRATLFVSGGRSPAELYKALSQQALDWSKVTIALVDERWVDETNEFSNAAFIRQCLLQGPAAAATFVGMKNAASSAMEGAALCNENYANINGPWSLSLIGMGPDGHFASLFPRAEGLSEALHEQLAPLCSAIQAKESAVTGSITERMSLSLAGILKSEKQILMISGAAKLAVYQRALSSDDSMALPVRALLQHDSLDVYYCP